MLVFISIGNAGIKHQNGLLVSTETAGHLSSYIIVLPRYNAYVISDIV